MKSVLISLVLAFVIVAITQAQQESYSKATDTRTVREEIVYEPVVDPVPLSSFNDGSGGNVDCFYYGDPSGMFLNEDWQKGSAELIEGEALEGSFRYNIYKQKMEAVIDADTFAFAKPCEIDELKIGDHKFIYSTYVRSDQEVSNTWFEVLCEGGCTLLLRRYIKYRVTDGDDDHSDDQLYRLEEYYTMKEKGSPERLFESKKSVMKALEDHEDELMALLKSEKLRLKERNDLIELFAYYNAMD